MKMRTKRQGKATSYVGAAVLGIAAMAATAFGAVDLGTATDDLWVYPHSADPGGDPVIRVWGARELDINPTGYPGQPWAQSYFSYGYVQWDLDDVPPDTHWNGATLTVTVADGSTFDPSIDGVYLRGVTGTFDESNWVFGDDPAPIASARLVGVVSGNAEAGDTVTFDIPRNIDQRILQSWAKRKKISLMISSDTDFELRGGFLRIAAEENLLFDGPQLVLK